MRIIEWTVMTCAGAVIASISREASTTGTAKDVATRLQEETYLQDFDCDDSAPAETIVPKVPVKPVLRFETKTRPAPVLKVESKPKSAPASVKSAPIPQPVLVKPVVVPPAPIKVAAVPNPELRKQQHKIVKKPKKLQQVPQVKKPVPKVMPVVNTPQEKQPEHEQVDVATATMRKQLLDTHNLVRAAHGLEPFTWNDTLTAYAQKWADKCVYEHSPAIDYGENIALGYYFHDVTYAVKAFYDEYKTFDWSHGAYDEQHGHVSQMLWDDTKQLGCALQKCDKLGGQGLLFCEYDPPGNVINNPENPTPEEAKEFRSHMRPLLPNANLPAWLLANDP